MMKASKNVYGMCQVSVGTCDRSIKEQPNALTAGFVSLNENAENGKNHFPTLGSLLWKIFLGEFSQRAEFL